MSAAFWDRLARRYAARPVRDAAAYARTLERTAAWLSPSDAVVEFGCGTGTTALALAGAAARIDATDFSAGMIAIAREKAEVEGAATVAFTQADLFDAGAVPGPYDAALAFNFLQLMPDLPGALAAISHRLKPGGLLISKTVCIGEPGWRLARVAVRGLKAFGVAPPLQFHQIATLDRAVEDAGFAILERGVFPERPPARFLVARKAG
ncbi:class I SAM-dependent DNA methyltransferase [Rubrimonas cliftonensis]|uniref:Methyltransferase domain-containing protein n=1 Tax=Rubrimonas cliftonensis TaxID=89524 RepID=A0A1H3YFD5_9RHOB|nr:class I SAM-dependent methyltransferase [Rubrimonas cliftonensis]SEA10257.1 Methyltransferase domain-containing protein [Rubrimonas cliftonensis]